MKRRTAELKHDLAEAATELRQVMDAAAREEKAKAGEGEKSKL